MRRLRTEHDERIKPGELRSLLERLHAEDLEPDPQDDHTTVAAVCEATGASELRVWQLLEKIRADDLESRLAQRLAEAEEPLYRVERPGTSHDSLSTSNWFGRQRAISTVLDSLPRPGRRKLDKKKKVTNTGHDHVSNWASLLILLLVVGLVLYIIVRAMQSGTI